MWNWLKKASMRTQANQVLAGASRLVDTLLRHEAALVAGLHLDEAEKIKAAFASAACDVKVQEALRRFQFQLLGPLSMTAIRDDLIVPFLAQCLPDMVPGHVVAVAMRDALADVADRWSTEDCPVLWPAIRAEVWAKHGLRGAALRQDLMDVLLSPSPRGRKQPG